MKIVEKDLVKELRVVNLYLVDIGWILHRFDLDNIKTVMSIIQDENEFESENIDELTTLTKHETKGFAVIDSDRNYFVQFFPKQTLITFKVKSNLSKAIFYDVCEYLSNKQRFFIYSKQNIHFSDKTQQPNFLKQDKVPIWLLLLMFVLGGLVTKAGELLLEAILKKP